MPIKKPDGKVFAKKVRSSNKAFEWNREQLESKLNPLARAQAHAQKKRTIDKLTLHTLNMTDAQKETRAHAIKELDSHLAELQRKTLKKDLPTYRVIEQFIKTLTHVKADLRDEKGFSKLQALTHDLITLSKNFVKGSIDYSDLKKLSKEALAHTKKEVAHLTIREPHTLLEKISEVLRKFFNYLDKAISWALGSKETMAEKGTPFAKRLTGRSNFFNKPETVLGKELRQFEEALLNLTEASPGKEKSPLMIKNQ